MLLLLAAAAAAQSPWVEAGVQAGALDARGALGEKPAIAGGRVTVRAWRLMDAEVEINRFPIGGAASNFPGTQLLVGARAGYRTGGLGLFATLRPGFLRFDHGNLNRPDAGTRPVLELGIALGFYSSRHIFVRFDFGDVIVWYGPAARIGTRHQFQGTVGFGLWL